jgi:KDO2-lipid IV(A) lauroyltransferase
MKIRIRDWVVYIAARAAIGLAARVPETLGYGFARWLGRLYLRCDRRRQRYAMHFLRNAYPERSDRELRELAAESTGHLFCVPLDMARLTRLLARGGNIREVVDLEPAKPGLAAPPPFLALTAHLGGWEAGAVAMAQVFGGAHGVARVSKNPLLQRWILRNRQAGGLTIHPRRGGFRGLAQAVRGGAVGLQVVDQNQRLRGVFAPFFGEIASCERAAVSLALRCNYPVVVGAGIRIGRGFRFKLVLGEPFWLQRTGDKAQDLLLAVTAVNQRLEALIRQAPEQYLWIHDRYRTKPPAGGAASDGGATEPEDDGPEAEDDDA